MTLSQKAWAISSEVITAINSHPFNQELKNGTLSLDRFAYYIEQDSLYLQDFARCHAIIASRIAPEHIRCFLHYSDNIFIIEQEVVHDFFKKAFNFKETGKLTPATLNYTSYLLRVCSLEPVEVGIAALLPCFWVYREVGLNIFKDAKPDNPFGRWIDTYASKEFSAETDKLIDIFDEFGEKTTEQMKIKMLDAFYKCACLEWHFWNDAYNKTTFDGFKK